MEFVFVVPRRDLFPECYPQGFRPFGEAFSESALRQTIARHGFFVERDHAERTPDLKQIIPYSVVLRDDEVLLLRRLRAGGEARLHDKLSIGVGGHINPEDMPAPRGGIARDPIDTGSRRELHEELEIENEVSLQRVGILNDDSNSVGAVHVGVVQLVRTTGRVDIREKAMLEGRFVPLSELRRRAARDGADEGAAFETWSARLVESLDEWLPDPRPGPSPRPVATRP
jgi:predicted NUDIX family phosphoesterase